MGKGKGRNKKPRWKKVNQKKDGSPGRENGQDFVERTVEQGNFKMEAYYAAQGLHHQSIQRTETSLLATTNNITSFDDWNRERLAWRAASGRTLPASFRFCQCQQIVSDDMAQAMQTELKALLQQAKEWKKDETTTTAKEEEKVDDRDNKKRQYTPIVYEPLNDQDVQLTTIPFCPHAYQLPLDRTLIRKHPALKPLHQWLMNKTDCGYVTRQETVSMIPPIVLLSQESSSPSTTSNGGGNAILDMCAAPGSKTSQLLEGLASAHQERAKAMADEDGDNNNSTTGLLVANDVNPSRAHMLMHQLKRILHHFPVAMVTAAAAQHFPSPPSCQPGEGRLFDKILADVPCSGDGTTRKNIHVWKTWSQMGALALHKLQLDIAFKGAATLLKIGGHLCYSTCSLNPVEDEAVVAELLRRAGGGLELVDITSSSSLLKSFVTRPGLSSWKVLCEPTSRRELKNRRNKNNAKMQQRRKEYEEQQQKEGEEAEGDDGREDAEMKEEEPKEGGDDEQVANGGERENDTTEETKLAPNTQKFEPTSMDEDYLMDLATNQAGLMHFKTMDDVPEEMMSRVRPSNFPPTPEETARFHLERCIRVLGHDNDTGGFFVALLKKVGPVGGQDRRDEKRQQEAAAAAAASVEGVNEANNSTSPPPKRAKLDDDNVESLVTEDIANIDSMEDDGGEAAESNTKNSGGDSRGKRNPKFEPEFVPVKDEIMDPLIEFYGLGGPGFRKDLFMQRASGSDVSKILTYVSPAVKDLLDHNMDIQKRVSIIATGLKAFTKNTALKETPITHRLAQEAAHFMVPHMSDKRKLSVTTADFEVALGIVTSNNNNEAEAKESDKGKGGKNKNAMNVISIDKFSPEFQSRARKLDVGAFVTVLEGFEDRHDEKMVLVLWRCRGDHVNTLVAKTDVDAIVSKVMLLKKDQET